MNVLRTLLHMRMHAKLEFEQEVVGSYVGKWRAPCQHVMSLNQAMC